MKRHLKCATKRRLMTFKYILFLNPYGAFISVAAVLLGAMGAIFGTIVSQGMTNSLRGTAGPLSHIWGLIFATGGSLKLWGMFGRLSAVEVPGLWMMLGGYAFYSVTVSIGLAAHGMAAGIISGAIAAGIAIKIRTIVVRPNGEEDGIEN